jgi:hypothetical protein
MAPIPDVERAHQHSSRHRSEIEASERCGCFYCLRTFAPDEIEDWLVNEQTALCPHCMIDSVLGSASGFPITAEFLRRMHARWFEMTVPFDTETEDG